MSAKKANESSSPKRGSSTLAQMVEGQSRTIDSQAVELRNRAEQIYDLCKVAMTLLVLVRKIDSGDFTEDDHSRFHYPTIHIRRQDGTKEASAYIRTTLMVVKPMILRLAKDNATYQRERAIVEDIVTQAQLGQELKEDDTLFSRANYSNMKSLTLDIEELD
jgi:hypothetical protein